jgi:peptidoglycan/LPS O-acetylase OafA/YrhL
VAIAVTRRRERYIDGLRACAAIHVLLNHCFLEVYPSEFGVRPTGVMHITREMSVSGLGVAVFIVLSGYSLAMSVHRDGWRLRDGTRAFLRRRARRLMPPYYAALLITLVLSSTVISKQTGTHWDSAVPFDARDVIGHLLLVQNVVGDPYTISHPLWSIAMTWHVYVAMPLILIAVRRWGVVATAAVAIVVTTAIAVGSGHNQQVVLLFRALQLFGLFTVGLAALAVSRADGVLTVRGRELRPPWTLIGVTWLAIWLVARVNHVPFGIGVACLIVAMSQGGARPLRAVLEWRLARHDLVQPLPRPRADHPSRLARDPRAPGLRGRARRDLLVAGRAGSGGRDPVRLGLLPRGRAAIAAARVAGTAPGGGPGRTGAPRAARPGAPRAAATRHRRLDALSSSSGRRRLPRGTHHTRFLRHVTEDRGAARAAVLLGRHARGRPRRLPGHAPQRP